MVKEENKSHIKEFERIFRNLFSTQKQFEVIMLKKGGKCLKSIAKVIATMALYKE